MIDTDLPPAMFDLEYAPMPEGSARTVVARRPGHQLTIQPPYVTCQCDARTMNGDYDQLVKWIYAHLGVAYDTDIDRAVRR